MKDLSQYLSCTADKTSLALLCYKIAFAEQFLLMKCHLVVSRLFQPFLSFWLPFLTVPPIGIRHFRCACSRLVIF